MTARLFTVGLVSILGQVCLLRELNVAFYGTELIYVLALGVWLLWTALGAVLGRRAFRPSGTALRLLFLAFAVALPLDVAFVRALRETFGGVPGAYLPFMRQMAAMLVSLMPLALLSGMLFRSAARDYVGVGRTVARAYAVESAGGLFGGVLATLSLAWEFSNLATALGCACLSLAVAWFLYPAWRPRWLIPIFATIAVCLVWVGVRSQAIDFAMTAWAHPDLVATHDSPYGRVTLTKSHRQLSVFVNDALAFENEGTAAEEFVHLAALQVASPRRVLVLGGGHDGLVREVLKHRPEVVDVVEMDGVLLDLVLDYIPADDRAALLSAGVRLHVEDGRAFQAEEHYDLILVGMPEPDSGQANRFYTAEFFRQCVAMLDEDGVLALRLRSQENLWTPHLLRRMAGIRAALAEAFQDVLILPGGTNVVLASNKSLTRDSTALSERWQNSGITARLVSPPYLRYMLTNDRIPEMESLLAGVQELPNTDAHPACYRDTMMLWLSLFSPALAMRALPLWEGEVWGIPSLLAGVGMWLGLLWLARRRPGLRRGILVGVAGMAGMVLEGALILNDQVKRGALFQDLGVLLTLFMAGLAVGALAVERMARLTTARPMVPRWLAFMAVGGLAVLGFGTGALLEVGIVNHIAASGGLLFLSGMLVAAVFATASLHEPEQSTQIVTSLYAADLLGGAAGAVVGGLLLIPFLGLGETAALMGCLALTALILA